MSNSFPAHTYSQMLMRSSAGRDRSGDCRLVMYAMPSRVESDRWEAVFLAIVVVLSRWPCRVDFNLSAVLWVVSKMKLKLKFSEVEVRERLFAWWGFRSLHVNNRCLTDSRFIGNQHSETLQQHGIRKTPVPPPVHANRHRILTTTIILSPLLCSSRDIPLLKAGSQIASRKSFAYKVNVAFTQFCGSAADTAGIFCHRPHEETLSPIRNL